MQETVVSVGIEEAYSQLRTLLSQNNCRITAEQAPKNLRIKQGSLWGISPKTAQKTVVFQLSQNGSETQIESNSSLSPDYLKLTVIGCVFAVALALLCAWISLDLAGFAASQKPSFWSWLTEAGGYVDTQGAILLSNLTRVFAVFLAVTLALEAFVVAYVRSKINVFAEEILKNVHSG